MNLSPNVGNNVKHLAKWLPYDSRIHFYARTITWANYSQRFAITSFRKFVKFFLLYVIAQISYYSDLLLCTIQVPS